MRKKFIYHLLCKINANLIYPMQNTSIFPLFYLPSISYFTEIKENPILFLEKFEHFPKQTYRNRASICSPEGMLDLTIPVAKGSKLHTVFKDVKISTDYRWQRLHWLSLQNNYRSSAYFEYYEDELISFYEKSYTFLFDYNLELLEWLLKKLKLTPEIQFTKRFEAPQSEIDYRVAWNKKSIPNIANKPYFQVFNDRNPFVNNLSIVDLLFNQGPQSKKYF